MVVSVENLEEVKQICQQSDFCKSKWKSERNFIVTTKNQLPPIYVKTDVSSKNMKTKLKELLHESNFLENVASQCEMKLKSECRIIIKPNISVAVQKEYKTYSEPILADTIVNVLDENGYKNVQIVESDANFKIMSDLMSPNHIAKKLGYSHTVQNITNDPFFSVPYKKGTLHGSKTLSDSDMVINIAKAKNHPLTYFTGALKNMYGAIPDQDKYRLFHGKQSGLGIEEATTAINHITPSDFTIIDMIHSIDGNINIQQCEINDEFFKAGMLVAGEDPFFLDKWVAMKFGYSQNQSEIVKDVSLFRKDFDVRTMKNAIYGIKRDEKFATLKDSNHKSPWKKHGKLKRRGNKMRDWFVLKALRLPNSILKKGMCLFKYNVLTLEEKEMSCK